MIGPWQRAAVQLGERKWASLKFPRLNGNTDHCCCAVFQTWSPLWNHTKGPGLLWSCRLSMLCPFWKMRSNWNWQGEPLLNVSMSVTLDLHDHTYVIHLHYFCSSSLSICSVCSCQCCMLSNLIRHHAHTLWSGFTTSMCNIFRSCPGYTWRKIEGYFTKRVEWDGRMREVRIHGGPRGCSEGSFAPFLVAM